MDCRTMVPLILMKLSHRLGLGLELARITSLVGQLLAMPSAPKPLPPDMCAGMHTMLCVFFPLRCYLSILDDGGYHEVFRGCSPDKSTLRDRCRPRRPVYL